ncbi:hypothetical protein GTP23_20245 [Pseudoduganella sp. FT93W]|uniref:O-antigen ligase-related domain-containing protein n=1 Tax=Duganella fentianensis TaxID=2692177 RepID=A0A845I6Y6_9BURK|nr:O-antigen ligase family protein [Duganella fentianensis]MYN47378.1 hypothetical protein [Duganella fentianensis]
MGYSVKKAKSSHWVAMLIGLTLAVVFGLIGAVADGWLALLLFAPIIPVALVLADFRIGAVLLMVLLPLQNSPLLPNFTGFNIINFIVLGTMVSMYLSYFGGKVKFFRISKVYWWAYLLPIFVGAAIGVMHLGNVPNIDDFILYQTPFKYLIGMIIKPLFTLLVAWMVGVAVTRSKRPELFLVPLVLTAVMPAILVIVFVFRNGLSLAMLASEHQRGLLSSLGMHANGFGQFFGLGFILLLFLFPVVTQLRHRIWLTISLALVTLALLMTFSRGGYVVALVGMLSFLFIQRRLRYAVVLACFAVAAAFLAPDAVVGRVTTGLNASATSKMKAGKVDELTAGRVWIWGQVVPEIARSPVWGRGVGSIAWSEPVQRGLLFYIHPHNMFLRLLMDLGLLGFMVMAYFTRYLFRQLRAVGKIPGQSPYVVALAQGMVIVLLGILVSGMSGGHYIAGPETVIFWMGLGVLLPFLPRPAKRGSAAVTQPEVDSRVSTGSRTAG